MFWAMKGWFFNAINIETVKYLKEFVDGGNVFFQKQSEPLEIDLIISWSPMNLKN